MRKRKYGPFFLCVAAVLLCLAATVLYTVVFILPDDTRPPVISMASDTLEVSISATDAELLAGVTAVDARDGDVTDSILVQGVTGLEGDHATITYAAFDEAGNVAKATRSLRYTDYTGPRIGLRSALVFNSGTSMDVLDRVSGYDMRDGDISLQVRATLVSNTGSLSYPGVHMVEFRVTNSLGDTGCLTLPVDVVTAGTYNASVELSDYLIYLPKGSDFNARRYLKSLQTLFGDEITDNVSDMNISMESNVNTNVPGVYSVRYTASCTVGSTVYTGYTRLNVVVED